MSPPIINFPTLQPAIVWKVNVGAGHPIGMRIMFTLVTFKRTFVGLIILLGPRQSGATLIHFVGCTIKTS